MRLFCRPQKSTRVSITLEDAVTRIGFTRRRPHQRFDSRIRRSKALCGKAPARDSRNEGMLPSIAEMQGRLRGRNEGKLLFEAARTSDISTLAKAAPLPSAPGRDDRNYDLRKAATNAFRTARP